MSPSFWGSRLLFPSQEPFVFEAFQRFVEGSPGHPAFCPHVQFSEDRYGERGLPESKDHQEDHMFELSEIA
jgi:hypothetical protein